MSEFATSRDDLTITEKALNPLDSFMEYTFKLRTNVDLELNMMAQRRNYDSQSLPLQLSIIPGVLNARLVTGDPSSTRLTAVLVTRKPGTDRTRVITDVTAAIADYCFPLQPMPPQGSPSGLWQKIKLFLLEVAASSGRK